MAPRDEFDDEGFFDSLLNRKGKTALPSGLRRIFIVIGILILASLLVAVIASSLKSGDSSSEDAAVPIIRADTEPFKVKPQDPGGMKVPNKDSTIFETLKGEKEEKGVENLLEDPSDTAASIAREEVASKVESKSVPLTDVKLEKTGAPPEEDLVSANPPQPVPVTETTPVVLKETSPVKAPEVKTEPKVVETKKPVSVIETLKADSKSHAETVAPKPASLASTPLRSGGGSAYIQLAAVKSEAEASTLWSKFKAKNPELSGLSMRTQKADLGAKGIFYRIQAGPLSPTAATQACTAVKARGGSCIIAK